MIFQNLSTFQNILFIIACLGIVLVICYLILYYCGIIKLNKNATSDDIDDELESYKNPTKFIFNAFSLKGSIFFIAITSSVGFFLSIFLNIWLSLVIGIVLAVVFCLIIAYVDREPLGKYGEAGLVSVEIPPKSTGYGKVILQDEGIEIDASTEGKLIKKGKKVIILKNNGNSVVVRKHK